VRGTALLAERVEQDPVASPAHQRQEYASFSRSQRVGFPSPAGEILLGPFQQAQQPAHGASRLREPGAQVKAIRQHVPPHIEIETVAGLV
jgi:hypothetical protein